MATRSVDDFLSVDEEKDARGLHRSRSGGYQDFLEEQVAWERRDRERQMRKYYGHRPQASDRLYVPTFDIVHRRVRSQEEINEKKEDGDRAYHLREQKPAYDLKEDLPLPSQLPVKRAFSWKPDPKKTKVQVVIDQPTAPPSPALGPLPKKSPTGSPSSPSRPRVQLQFQFATLQNKFAEITTICSPHLHIEGANARDLTFSKISEEVNGLAFQLRIWHEIVNMENMTKIDRTKRDIVDKAAKTLDRLIDRVEDLSRACAAARPRDLKTVSMPELDDDEEYDGYSGDDDDRSETDVTETLGFEIQAHLRSIRLQVQTLSRLTRSLQEATPDACAEVEAVEGLVREVGKYFGSEDAMDRYHIDERFAGRKALEEAKSNRGYVR